MRNNQKQALLSLTPIEKSIIKILFLREVSLNTKQIQNEFIINVLKFGKGNFSEKKEIKEVDIDNILPYTPPLPIIHLEELLPYYRYNSNNLNKIEERYHKKAYGLLSQVLINDLKKYLRKIGIKFPSFDKINSDLKQLKRMGLICMRESGDKKTKGLWYIRLEVSWFLQGHDVGNKYKNVIG